VEAPQISSMARLAPDPRAKTKGHRPKPGETYHVQEGGGEIEAGSEHEGVGQDDAIHVPPDAAQQTRNAVTACWNSCVLSSRCGGPRTGKSRN